MVQLVLSGLVLVPLCYASTTLKLHTASKINFLRKIELFHDIQTFEVTKCRLNQKIIFVTVCIFDFGQKYSNLCIEKSVLEYYLRHYF